jgi:2'-5' RNA ligase
VSRPAEGASRGARLFFALWPDEACRAQLGEVAATALSVGGSGRAVPAQDWHVTLCFLGSVPAPAAAELAVAAARVRVAPFTLHFNRLRYWADSRVTVAIGPCPPAAARLAAAVRALSRQLGLSVDDAELQPHITLIRGQDAPPPGSRSGSGRERGLALDVTLAADALVLAESREGVVAPAARYVVRASWPFGDGDPAGAPGARYFGT